MSKHDGVDSTVVVAAVALQVACWLIAHKQARVLATLASNETLLLRAAKMIQVETYVLVLGSALLLGASLERLSTAIAALGKEH